jgi:hypothetical protein
MMSGRRMNFCLVEKLLSGPETSVWSRNFCMEEAYVITKKLDAVLSHDLLGASFPSRAEA